MVVFKLLWYLQRLLLSCGIQTSWVKMESDRLEEIFAELRPVQIEQDLIRVGDGNDGTYVVPNDLDGVSKLISPGVGNQVEFENYLSQLGIECELFDGTVERPNNLSHSAKFTKINVSGAPRSGHISLTDIVSEENGDLILQIDVEGDEYDIIPKSKNVLDRFRIIIVEIHGLETWVTKPGLSGAWSLLSSLRASHSPVFLRANPYRKPFKVARGKVLPSAVEVTFLRNDRLRIDETNPAALSDLPKFGIHEGYLASLYNSWF